MVNTPAMTRVMILQSFTWNDDGPFYGVGRSEYNSPERYGASASRTETNVGGLMDLPTAQLAALMAAGKVRPAG